MSIEGGAQGAFKQYLRAIQKDLAAGDATEQTNRPAQDAFVKASTTVPALNAIAVDIQEGATRSQGERCVRS